MTDAATAPLRAFHPDDTAALRRVAVAAFEPFACHYNDWPAMEAGVSRMPDLAAAGELIVADIGGNIAGGVAYIPAGGMRVDFFDPAWPVIRMLVVDPAARGNGLGRALTEECVRRARRDGAPIIALHTSEIMTVALPMYLRMGFVRRWPAPAIHGVPAAVYTLDLTHA